MWGPRHWKIHRCQTPEAGTEVPPGVPLHHPHHTHICLSESETPIRDHIPWLLVLIGLLSWLCVGFHVMYKQYLLFPSCCLKYLLRQYALLHVPLCLWDSWDFGLFLIRKFPHNSDLEAHTQAQKCHEHIFQQIFHYNHLAIFQSSDSLNLSQILPRNMSWTLPKLGLWQREADPVEQSQDNLANTCSTFFFFYIF